MAIWEGDGWKDGWKSGNSPPCLTDKIWLDEHASFQPRGLLVSGVLRQKCKKTFILSHFILMVRLCEPISRPLGELGCTNLACNSANVTLFTM